MAVQLETGLRSQPPSATQRVPLWMIVLALGPFGLGYFLSYLFREASKRCACCA